MAARIARTSRPPRRGLANRRSAARSCRRARAAAKTPVLVDCLTLWLTNRMLADADIEAEIGARWKRRLASPRRRSSWSRTKSVGIVPDIALGRRFRDLQGILNQRMAARADRVVLMVAGLAARR